MADTNPPQGSPGAPSGLPTGVPPNAVPKIELSQMMDISKFQRDLSDIIMNSFGDAGSQVEGLLLPKSFKAKKLADLSEIDKKQQEIAKKFADAEMTFLKQVSTKQRYNFEMMKQQKASEYSQLQKSGMGQKQLSDYKVSAEKQINLARMAAEKSEGKAGAALGLQVAAAGEYLTSMGAVLGIWEVLVKVIMQAFNSQMVLSRSANALRAGGLFKGGQGAESALGMQSKVFGGSGMMFSTDTFQGWVKQLAKVPITLESTGGDISKHMHDMLGTLGTEFENVDQIIGTLSKAAEDTGMTMDQLSDAFKGTKGASNALKIDHLRQLNTQIQMRAAMRGVTTDANAATEMMNALVEPLKKIGASGVAAEVQRMEMSMAKFVGGMSISKMTGMSAFVNGGRIPTDKEMDKIMDHPVQLMNDYFQKLNRLNPNTNMKYLFAEKAAEKSGLQLGDARQVKAFAEYMENIGKGTAKEMTKEELQKQFGYKDTNAMIAEGLANLAKQRDIKEEVTELLTSLMEKLGFPLINGLGSIQFLINKYGAMIPTNPLKAMNARATKANLAEATERAKYPQMKPE